MKRIFFCTMILVLTVFRVTGADALEVRLVGDKLTVRAEKVPLQNVLRRLDNLGIRVRIDPDINPTISASFDEGNIERGLKTVLRGLNYALMWESVEGPFGPMPKLSEIQVFKPGEKNRMEAFKKKTVLSIVRDPKTGGLFVQDELLLRLKPGMSALALKRLLGNIGGTIVDSYPAIGIYKIRLPENTDIPSLVDEIHEHPGIGDVEPNYAYPIAAPYIDAESLESPSASIDAAKGKGVPIAILDSGLLPESGLENLVMASIDALNPSETISDPLGHGTQMALIASGVVSPDGVRMDSDQKTSIIPIRAFDENGFTSGFHIMSSIDFALKNGARVMSLSWGTETKSEFLEDALKYAGSKGLITIAAAGNEPTGEPFYPAAYNSVIGVGALGQDGKPWEKSNYGDFVMLYGPGFATLPIGHKGEPGTYAGTSISTAFVAHVIADYLSDNPDANLEDVLNGLRKKSR